MKIDTTLRTIKPDPDSQYRLRPCQVCDGDDVAYVQYEDGERTMWRAQCFSCGHAGQGCEVRHEAQVDWNGAAL